MSSPKIAINIATSKTWFFHAQISLRSKLPCPCQNNSACLFWTFAQNFTCSIVFPRHPKRASARCCRYGNAKYSLVLPVGKSSLYGVPCSSPKVGAVAMAFFKMLITTKPKCKMLCIFVKTLKPTSPTALPLRGNGLMGYLLCATPKCSLIHCIRNVEYGQPRLA